jgi:hypothetical protein
MSFASRRARIGMSFIDDKNVIAQQSSASSPRLERLIRSPAVLF